MKKLNKKRRLQKIKGDENQVKFTPNEIDVLIKIYEKFKHRIPPIPINPIARIIDKLKRTSQLQRNEFEYYSIWIKNVAQPTPDGYLELLIAYYEDRKKAVGSLTK